MFYRGVFATTIFAILYFGFRQAVYGMYMQYGDEEGWDTSTSREYFTEQGQLLWMTRELDAKGKPVLWEPPAWLV